MTLRQRISELTDARVRLLVQHDELSESHALAQPSDKGGYRLLLQQIERELSAVEARLQMVEANAKATCGG